MATWFSSWFDSPLYHKLYFDRDEVEAQFFITSLITHLNPPPNSKLLDIACGKGRHAKALNNFGYFVTGIDLSEYSIEEALHFSNPTLEFFVHDMRLPFRINYYNYAFNLFTSFGYFDTQREHDNALRTFYQSLQPGGYFVLDYLNSNYIAQHLVAEEVKQIDEVTYNISRKLEGNKFVKTISIKNNETNQVQTHHEKVAAFTKPDFEKMLAKQGFKVLEVFGSYALSPYHEKESKRLIIIAQK
jgi:SAM-dependent methyltransferase